MDEKRLIVTEIERSAIHDGPGLRTVVFLQGCPLRCFWCCNPETQSLRPVLLHDLQKCVGCGACVLACPEKAVALSGGKARVDRGRCVGCGSCVEVCPTGVNTISGKEMTLTDILTVVSRDRAYYGATGGGLTLSGGEPLLQPAAVELLRLAKEAGFSTWLETTAFVGWEVLERAAACTDGFYVDYKHPDAGALRRATGAELSVIEENIRRLMAGGAALTLRTPVVPGFNDSEAVLEQCFAFARSVGCEDYVLLPYHSLGRGKYDKLGLSYTLDGVSAMTPAELESFARLGRELGLSVRIGG